MAGASLKVNGKICFLATARYLVWMQPYRHSYTVYSTGSININVWNQQMWSVCNVGKSNLLSKLKKCFLKLFFCFVFIACPVNKAPDSVIEGNLILISYTSILLTSRLERFHRVFGIGEAISVLLQVVASCLYKPEEDKKKYRKLVGA